ncbi:MAG: 3-isopropylmalate dehydratase small subunit [gamma proteobacterium symbiont of Bathyaustriella thionipta]|nr:3-isopropylmalate dehydratase small subunit [gamma proteobacterium symbiont of Bathyaustriella thionipta]
MKAYTQHTGIVMPLDRANVDTDAIIPKQFLKSIKRSGFGPNLFDEWRYLDQGEPGMDNRKRPLNPDFVLNDARYQGASILLARENFGCGSSREHAPWALEDYGFHTIIASSFADIFYNNCFKNGILPIVLEEKIIENLFDLSAAEQALQLTIDLATQSIKGASILLDFEVEAHRKHNLMNGLDDIGLTLQCAEDIRQYEMRRKNAAPWLFRSV